MTRNATTLELPHIGLTTGNSYTIALALEAIERAVSERGIDPAEATLAVVGASGNIGQTCAEILAPRYATDACCWAAASPRRSAVCASLQARLPRAQVEVDPAALRAADVVLAAANAPTPFLDPERVCRRRDRLRSLGAGGRSPGGEESRGPT